MLALAEELGGDALPTKHPVVFAATTCEEGAGDLRGAKHLFEEEVPDACAAIALDGAGDERVVHRALGSRRFRIVYRGIGGHSWAAFGVPNAVHAAAECAALLARVHLPLQPRTTLSVCRIGGGMSVNAIPDEAWLEVDLRSTSVDHLDRFEREIRTLSRRATAEENARRARGTQALTSSVQLIGDRPCGVVDERNPIVAAALGATELIGREPELATASTDANIPISLGIPAIAIGAGGRGGNAHTCGEWYENLEGALGIARALTIIMAIAGLA
jgi:acetylornithine deacetylase/succinyl-diaminopimelate desuccinylase-like protein